MWVFAMFPEGVETMQTWWPAARICSSIFLMVNTTLRGVEKEKKESNQSVIIHLVSTTRTLGSSEAKLSLAIVAVLTHLEHCSK
jgi:hypothetical protein